MDTLDRQKQIHQFWSKVEETPEGYELAIDILLKIVAPEDLQRILDEVEDWESIIWDESQDQ